MKPDDDVTWPVCDQHTDSHWCSHVRDLLALDEDAKSIEAGSRYCIPIVPESDLYAEISIDPEQIGIAHRLALVKTSLHEQFGMDNEELVYLGMWTPGEGRRVICDIVADWTLANSEGAVCEYYSHSFKEEMYIQNVLSKEELSSVLSRSHHWTLAFYKKCFPCYQKALRPLGMASEGWTATSFGLDDASFAANIPHSMRQHQTQEALRSRYGKT